MAMEFHCKKEKNIILSLSSQNGKNTHSKINISSKDVISPLAEQIRFQRLIPHAFLFLIIIMIMLMPLTKIYANQKIFYLDEVGLPQNNCNATINGYISNTSDRNFRYVSFRLRILDRDGNFINFISIIMKDFQAHSKRTFCERLMNNYPMECRFELIVKKLY
jgi:hypothetical protein